MAQAAPVCYHCGADCHPVHLQREEKDFCCEGCHTVYQIIHETGLKGYYDLNSHPGATGQKGDAGKYAFLEDESVISQLVEFREGTLCKVTFTAPDIHCSSCIWLLERLYKFREGILRSEVNFMRKEIYLTYDEAKISLRQVAELLAAIGYKPELSLARLEGGPQAKPDRSLWYKMGVAGFCAGNIMLLSFPEYLGLEELAFTRLFGYLNILLSLPVVIYSAQDYFRAAIAGLSKKHINIDVPISLGIVVLFLRSTLEILLDLGPGYLDSMAGLVFFLLIGKAFQRKTYDALSFERDYKSYFPISVTRLKKGEEEQIPLSKLQPGDRLLVRNGELIPADSLLLKGPGHIDYSFVTGESETVEKQAGELLYAGGRQEGGALEIEIIKEVSQSYLTRLWNNEVFQKEETEEIGRITSSVGKYFTLSIIAIAFIAGIAWFFVDPANALNVFTAILIVACPCALALSSPFTFGNTLRIFGRNGFFLKGAGVVETLARAKRIVFDKTGTLTQNGNSQVRFVGEELSDTDNLALKALFHQSQHPLSRELTRHLAGDKLPSTEEYQEIQGQGLQARIGGILWQAGSATFVGTPTETQAGQGSQVWVRKGETILGKFLLVHPYRHGIEEMVHSLEQDYRMSVLSGDNEREEARMKALFPAGTELRFRQSPEDKLAYIADLGTQGEGVIMVGDGLNDAGALRQSDAGISIAEDISAFTPASDAILGGASVARLGDFLAFAKTSMKVIYGSFVLSFLYNVVGLAFAITGNLSPLVAAILMPLSSVTIIVFTTVLTSTLARKKGL
ncbi:MAG: heavy metal translocating P-type ATPase metal-binding domain-containing protein [Bacteroidia bacterium]|nr:heavy metal translocating P-type ATPase metal-binding domain-containing protein [Bacteroidia bacterium]